MSKIGIIGHGYVGHAMERLFAGAFEIGIYDIATQPDDTVLAGASLILICVPTPMGKSGACDVSAVMDAAQKAVEICPDALICIKSAVPPGTADRLNYVHGTANFHVSPEYVGEGKNFVPPWDYPDPTESRSHDFVIVGGPQAHKVLNYFQRVMATPAR
ncbi:MAG: hypothetical protein LOX97_02230, partial [Sphingomonas sp.]|nr:hypothetical protein [Sphingomonas sp.]